MTPRLYLPQAVGGATLPGDRAIAHHAGRVLRLRPGATLQVFDGQGARFAATLLTLGERDCQIAVGERLPAPPDSPLAVTLVQGVSAADKMDWTIEKAVELGAAAIVPLMCERSQVRLDAARAQRRHEHWQRLIVAACMQCGRDRLPRLLPLLEPAELPATDDRWPDDRPCPSATRLLLAVPAGAAPPPPRLSAWPAPADHAVTVLAGPESGLTPGEVNLLLQKAFMPVTLGPRVLRTETAGLAALAALQVKFGDF